MSAALCRLSCNPSLLAADQNPATDDVPRAQVPRILARQAGVGALNGLLLAAVASGLTFVLATTGVFQTTSEPATLAVVVAIASLANLVIATVAGTAIPLILRRLDQDPALASSIFVTLITDVVGFGGFLLVAGLML